MKKILLFLLMSSLLITSCGNASNSKVQQPLGSEYNSAMSSESLLDASEDSLSSENSEQAKLSEDISQMMLDNFGGAGNPEYATSWYSYIDTITAYKDGEEYKVNVMLTEPPADMLFRGFTASYQSYFGELYDDFMSILVNTQTALKLEDTEACLVADDIYNILAKESDVSIYYASLLDLGVNAYKYISDATAGEFSEDDVRETASTLYGADFAGAILAGMESEFADASSALRLADITIIANTIKANYTDAQINQVNLLDPSGNIVYTA